jgi:hypothetical protein
MKTHELKTWPIFYKAIIDGSKTFEVRQNDRDFQLGDILLLREYDPDAEQYTGAKTERKIAYILGDNPFFQLNNMVILGIQFPPKDSPSKGITEEKVTDVSCTSNILACKHKGDDTCVVCHYNANKSNIPVDETGKPNSKGYFVKPSASEWIKTNGIRIINELGFNDTDRTHEGYLLMPEVIKAMEEYASLFSTGEKITDEEIQNAANDYWKDDVKENPDHLPFAPSFFAAYDQGAKAMRDNKIKQNGSK